jgi:hypothetical protein
MLPPCHDDRKAGIADPGVITKWLGSATKESLGSSWRDCTNNVASSGVQL